MTELQIRRTRFDFDDDVPFVWNPGNPAFSFSMNATSIIAICFEKMIVAAVKEALPQISDTAIAAEADAFLRQEAQHARAHRRHMQALIKTYPGLQETLDTAINHYDNLTATTPLAYRLAYIADLEATFTPSMKLMLDNEALLFKGGDDRVASLFLWHFVEEVEHRSSALIIYDAVVGKPWYRVRVLPSVVKHLGEVISIIANGVNDNVPEGDRGVDAGSMMRTVQMRRAVRRWLRLEAPDPNATRPSYAGIQRREKIIAVVNVLLSQTPFHKPANSPLPEFAERWLARYQAGDDVWHWYTSELAGKDGNRG
ncbi:metal-dependent hydrolase [Nocardia noduli]|uniref:metal-dependent hydrolase n=1 Tax=Nocardia noduli TaxID=2815722 RepID=UPI001C210278|nr:metal-dependent hydrolase [Nocardia noduli]